jgi:hypothetical protein
MILEDSAASLGTEGLLECRYINIHRGSSGPPISSEGEIRIIAVKEVTFADIIDQAGKIANCLNEEKRLPENKPRVSEKKSN